MSVNFTRRAAFAIVGGMAASAGLARRPEDVKPGPRDIRLGVCTYSFHDFARNLTISIMQLGIPFVSVKDFHIPYDSTPAEIAKAKADFRKAGLTIVSGGNMDLKDEDPALLRKCFEYAKNCGMPMIVGAPTHAALPAVEKLVKEFDISAAIHTHGPEDQNFPSPKVVLDAVKGMDPRMGLCMDVGHSMRTGADVVQEIANAGPRLLDMHMKDLRDKTDKKSQCDVGEGVMPVLAIFKQLKTIGYRGTVNLEYEINSDNPVPGMLHSLGYMHGMLVGMAG
jgi:sugar phosphate isomerase/epimerase